MGRHHCDNVARHLQTVKGVEVKDITRSSWTFSQNSARASVSILPGCCGILLFHNVSGAKRDPLRLLVATVKGAIKARFGMVLLSLKTDSELRKLLGPEWIAGTFVNPRTNNKVDLLYQVLPVKELKKKPQIYHED